MRRVQAIATLVALTGCVTLELPPGAGGAPSATVDDCAGCAATNDLAGEVMVLVNGKLSDASTGYTANLATADEHYLSGSVFLYDPQRAATLVKLGNLDLGPDPNAREGFRYLQFRDIAFDATHGLWGLTLENLNDEWRLTQVTGVDWNGHDQVLGHTTYGLRTTDAAYWESEIVGMGFVLGKLMLGARGTASGDAPGGALYATTVPTAFGIEPRYPDDPTYYAAEDLSTLCAQFPSQLGVAGDVAEGPDGFTYVMARAEHSNAGSLSENFLHRFQGGCPAVVLSTGVACPVVRNDDFQGLAWVEGELYAINTRADVYALDVDAGTCTLHEALAPLFSDPQKGVRIRGAGSVTLTQGAGGP